MQQTIFQQPTKKIKNKVTNKKVNAVMNTGVDNHIVNRGVELIGECFN